MKGVKGVLELDRIVSDILLIQYLNVLCEHSSFISLKILHRLSFSAIQIVVDLRYSNKSTTRKCMHTHARARAYTHKFSRAHLQPRRDLSG